MVYEREKARNRSETVAGVGGALVECCVGWLSSDYILDLIVKLHALVMLLVATLYRPLSRRP